MTCRQFWAVQSLGQCILNAYYGYVMRKARFFLAVSLCQHLP